MVVKDLFFRVLLCVVHTKCFSFRKEEDTGFGNLSKIIFDFKKIKIKKIVTQKKKSCEIFRTMKSKIFYFFTRKFRTSEIAPFDVNLLYRNLGSQNQSEM